MKTAIIYTSQTGFTKRYAEWIANAAGGELYPLKTAEKRDFSEYDAIVFGGWVCAGSIKGLKWFLKSVDKWAGKTLAVFCTGSSPEGSPEVAPMLNKIFNDSVRQRVCVAYCPAGLNYERMSLGSRLMLRLFKLLLSSKKNKSEAILQTLSVISSSHDITDKKYIEPIIKALK